MSQPLLNDNDSAQRLLLWTDTCEDSARYWNTSCHYPPLLEPDRRIRAAAAAIMLCCQMCGANLRTCDTGAATLVPSCNIYKLCLQCKSQQLNPLNTKLNPICQFLPLLGTHHILHVSGIRVNHKTYQTTLSLHSCACYFLSNITLKSFTFAVFILHVMTVQITTLLSMQFTPLLSKFALASKSLHKVKFT
jgi:hypothetical protein